MDIKLNFWIRFLLPFFLTLYLGFMLYMMSQFREAPDFEWYGLLWFGVTIFLMWECGWYINKRLNKKSNWEQGGFKRLMLQLISNTLAGIFIFLTTYIILNTYENQILNSNNPLSIFHLMVSTGMAFLIVQVINSIQIGYLLLNNWQRVQLKNEKQKKELAAKQLNEIRRQIESQSFFINAEELGNIIAETPLKVKELLNDFSDSYHSNLNRLDRQIEKVENELILSDQPINSHQNLIESKSNKSRFLVKSGPKMAIVTTDQIAGFYKDDLILLITKNGKKYVVDHSLEELTSMLSANHFFRINRQCLINFEAIQEIRPEGTQLSVNMIVDFPKPLFVSQRNTSDFKRWLNEG